VPGTPGHTERRGAAPVGRVVGGQGRDGGEVVGIRRVAQAEQQRDQQDDGERGALGEVGQEAIEMFQGRSQVDGAEGCSIVRRARRAARPGCLERAPKGCTARRIGPVGRG
jgi:hypothetical protein